MRTISICIPSYNRLELTLKSFEKVKNDNRVGEIIIVDDCSTDDSFEYLKIALKYESKVKLFRNDVNLNCYLNKIKCIGLAKNDWVIILDSDNEIGIDYLDALCSVKEWDDKTIYAPVFARETFDYRAFTGLTIDRASVANYMDKPMFSTALNTSNYFLNKVEFLKHIDTSINPNTAEAIFTNLNWFVAGNKIYFLEGLEYQHKVHAQSHYVLNNHLTGNFYNEVEQRLKQLK